MVKEIYDEHMPDWYKATGHISQALLLVVTSIGWELAAPELFLWIEGLQSSLTRDEQKSNHCLKITWNLKILIT